MTSPIPGIVLQLDGSLPGALLGVCPGPAQSGQHCHRALGRILFPPTTPHMISNTTTLPQPAAKPSPELMVVYVVCLPHLLPRQMLTFGQGLLHAPPGHDEHSADPAHHLLARAHSVFVVSRCGLPFTLCTGQITTQEIELYRVNQSEEKCDYPLDILTPVNSVITWTLSCQARMLD